MHAQITYELLMIAKRLQELGYHYAAAAFADINSDIFFEFYWHDEARTKVFNELYN